MRRIIRILTRLTAILLLSLITSCVSLGDEFFTIKRIGNIVSFSDNRFLVHSSQSGLLTIAVHDDGFTYRTIEQTISEGDTEIEWDGCGYNKERLFNKSYTVTGTLSAENGHEYTYSFQSPVEYTGQSLQYALPSSDAVSLQSPDNWFLEYKTIMKGQVNIDLIQSGMTETAYQYHMKTIGGKIYRKSFTEICNRAFPMTGQYTVQVYEVTKPEDGFSFPLIINDQENRAENIFLTGEIMPDASMNDEEIWNLMMKPSVVLDIDFFQHQSMFKEPDENSEILGTLHGQTQAIKVLSIENEWTLAGAWNHEEGKYIEGWIPTNRLKVEKPQNEYGILIDKKKQTLSVFRKGKKIDELLVSTGRTEKNKLYQETAAGSFLTGYHRVDFSMNGKKYDYVIQYDGGNLLHQIPYEWGTEKKDFTLGRGYLGAKASHACIRIQAEPGEGGINAYWIWTHIPYHTRVIILDDEENRINELSVISHTDTFVEQEILSSSPSLSEFQQMEEETVTITFGGTFNLKGIRANASAFDNYLSENDNEKTYTLFYDLLDIFMRDDLTCVQITDLFSKEVSYSEKQQDVLIKAAEFLSNFSLELVNIDGMSEANNTEITQKAKEIIALSADVLDRKQIQVKDIKNHRFGFSCCSESEYLSDPCTIDRRIRLLKEQQSEIIILFCNWGSDSNRGQHTVIQEAMARRCVSKGANLVIGNLSRTVQGIDYLEGIPVIYSLGEVLSTENSSRDDSHGMIAQVTFSFFRDKKESEVLLIPVNSHGVRKEKEHIYYPSVCQNVSDAASCIQRIWLDTSDAAFRKTRFMFQNQ